MKSGFSYFQPHITSLSSSNDATVGGGDVTVFGLEFARSGLSVHVGGVPCSDSHWLSETSIACLGVPSGIGTKDISVVGLDVVGTVMNSVSRFSYDAPFLVSLDGGMLAELLLNHLSPIGLVGI